MTGIEPASPAWEAGVLPMNYICLSDNSILAHFIRKFNSYKKEKEQLQ